MNWKRFRIPLALIAAGFMLVVAFGLLKDALVKMVVSRQVKEETGLEVQIGRVDYNVFLTQIEIAGLTIANPSDFSNGALVKFDRIFVDTTLSGLFAQDLRMQRLEIEIGSLEMQINEAGQSNFEVLQDKVDAGETGSLLNSTESRSISAGSDNFPGEKRRDTEASRREIPDRDVIGIDTLKIELGDLVLVWPKGEGAVRRRKVYPIDHVFEFRNVQSIEPVIQDLMLAIAMKGGGGFLHDLERIGENRQPVSGAEANEPSTSGSFQKSLNNLF